MRFIFDIQTSKPFITEMTLNVDEGHWRRHNSIGHISLRIGLGLLVVCLSCIVSARPTSLPQSGHIRGSIYIHFYTASPGKAT